MGRYNKIRREDISNGPGIRVSIFLQGCDFHCKGCFNSNTWDFDGGKELTLDKIDELISLCKKDYIKGLSILGGEPLHSRNAITTAVIAKKFKDELPNKTLWVWTGFLFEDIKDELAMEYIDVLVDGQFIEELKNPNLYYCGSSNQRVIDVQKSLKENKVILYKVGD